MEKTRWISTTSGLISKITPSRDQWPIQEVRKKTDQTEALWTSLASGEVRVHETGQQSQYWECSRARTIADPKEHKCQSHICLWSKIVLKVFHGPTRQKWTFLKDVCPFRSGVKRRQCFRNRTMQLQSNMVMVEKRSAVPFCFTTWTS